MDLSEQTYSCDVAPRDGGETHAPMGVCGMLALVWLWLGVVSRGILGRGVMHGAVPPTPVVSPTINRSQRRLYNHHPNSAVPTSRNLAPFYRFGPRVSATQFMERLCRLSVNGRIRVYRIAYWSSRLSREALMALFSRGDFRMSDGVWDAHIVPD